MSRLRFFTEGLPDPRMLGGRGSNISNAVPAEQVQAILDKNGMPMQGKSVAETLSAKTDEGQEALSRFLQERLGITPMEAAIGAGAIAGTGLVGGIAGADGGDAAGAALLGGTGAILADGGVRDAISRKLRPDVAGPMRPINGRGLVGRTAALAGAGVGGSFILDALGL